MEKSLKSGSFLEDVDIEISIRSGKTDLVVLQKLLNAIVASSQDLVDAEIVLTETETTIKATTEKKLTLLKALLQI